MTSNDNADIDDNDINDDSNIKWYDMQMTTMIDDIEW